MTVKLIKCVLLLSAYLWVTCCPTRGQASLKLTADEVVPSLIAAVNSVAERKAAWSGVDKEASEELSDLKKAADDVNVMTLKFRGKMPREWVVGLYADQVALKRASQGKPSPAKFASVRAVKEDLQVKRKHLKGAGAKGPFAKIPVEAATKAAGGKVEPGLEVWYVDFGLADDKTFYQRFPGHSSPAKEKLVPGVYAMWTKRPKGKESMQEKVTVSDMGMGRCEVDVSAP